MGQVVKLSNGRIGEPGSRGDGYNGTSHSGSIPQCANSHLKLRGRRPQAANSLDRVYERDELSRSARNWSTAACCSATVGIWKTRRRKAAVTANRNLKRVSACNPTA